MSFRSRLSLPLVCVLAVSCMDLNTGPNTVRPDLELTLAEFNTVSFVFSTSHLATMLGSVNHPLPGVYATAAACPLDPATTLFTCPKVVANGAGTSTFGTVRSYQLLDAAGLPLLAYDKSQVAAIRFLRDREGAGAITHSGTTEVTTWVDTVHSDFTMSGLLDSSQAVNGSGTIRATYNDTGVTQWAVTTFSMTNVAMPVLQPGKGFYDFPESGVVTHTVIVGGAAIATDTVTVLLTFTGSNHASYVRTLAGVTTHGTCYWNPGLGGAEGGCSLPVP